MLFNVNDGKRELVDEVRAQALVAAALQEIEATAITKASLTNKSYSEEAAAVLATALQDMTGLEEVDLSDMIAGRPEDVGLSVLRAICGALEGRTLRAIDLSDNAMGEKGINACRAALEKQPDLRLLKLCNDGLSASAMEAVCDILLSQKPTRLETLHFHNNMSGDGGAQALANVLPHCPHLRDFRFSGTRAGSAGSLAIAEALASCPSAAAGTFTRLDLADNSFGVEGGQVLAEALRNQPLLTFLSLRDAGLGDEGAKPVLAALEDNAAALEVLDLSGNELTADSMPALCRALAGKSRLHCLMAEENELGSRGAKELAEGVAGLPALDAIQLSTCEIGTSGAVALVRALVRKPSLKSVELNGNAISTEGVTRISRILEAAGKLDALGDMDDNDPDNAQEDEEEEEDDEGGEEEQEVLEQEEAGGRSNGDKGDVDADVDELARELEEIKM